MAEINIEKKQNSPFKNNKLVWLLVLFLFLIIGVIWLVGREDEEREAEEPEVIEQRISEIHQSFFMGSRHFFRA